MQKKTSSVLRRVTIQEYQVALAIRGHVADLENSNIIKIS